MNQVLYKLCCHCVGIMDGWRPFPSTILSNVCKMSLYETRKELKKLKARGLVVSAKMRTEESNLIMNGYTITPAAMETEEYKKAFEEERRLVKEIYGFDIKISEPADWDE